MLSYTYKVAKFTFEENNAKIQYDIYEMEDYKG